MTEAVVPSAALRANPLADAPTPPHVEANSAAPFAWQAGFERLGPAFFTALNPEPLPAPYWVGRSTRVAQRLGLSTQDMDSAALLDALTGNRLIEGSSPLETVRVSVFVSVTV